MINKKYLITAITLPILFLVTAVIYSKSLYSGFYLDDYPNLGSLPLVKEQGYLSYILGGVSSSLGRPLSLATFALQYGSWPDNPFAFKVVNLIIHLLNGILIFIFCHLLLSAIKPLLGNRQIQVFSLLTTALWLLHPIQQTTILYTIQRMTELSALFTLSGVIYYLIVRKQLIINGTLLYYLLSGAVLSIFLLAAVLSKENGILLPLYILIAEFTLFGSDHRSSKWKKWAIGFLVTPLLLLLIYLLLGLREELAGYEFRGYTGSDRLLTQATVLLLYLKNILLPHLSAFSLFNDDFPLSTGLISPFYTLPCIVIIGSILVAALLKRKSHPVISFGILFFFGGHILESSHLNLEMYFDHRNYLPVFGILFLINWYLFKLYKQFKLTTLAGGGLYYSFVFIITVTSVSLWSSPVEQMRVIINQHPYSVRANTYLLNSYIKSRDLVNAKQEIHNIITRFPDEIYPYLKDISVSACLEGNVISENKWVALKERAEIAPGSRFDNVSVLNNMAFLAVNGFCESIDKKALINLITTLIENNEMDTYRPHMYQIVATMYLNLGEEDKFIQMIIKASELTNSIPSRISYIQMVLMTGRRDIAMELLSALKNNIINNKRLAIAYHETLSELESNILSNQ